MEKRKIQIGETLILIAFGSNLSSELFGNPIENCIKAVEILKTKFKVEKISKFYKTEPIPKSSQSWFINGVVSIKTDYKPIHVLEHLMQIENSFKRIRGIKNDPRVIDLDLISYNDIVLNSKELVLPHPRMHERKFVLMPICDINEEWIHPVLKKKAKNLLKTLAKQKIFNINVNY